MTTVFDAAGKGSAKASWALMGRARADTVEPQSAAAKPSPFSRDASCKIKKPDMYWSAPRGAVRPVISAVEIGYVRRSEISTRSSVRLQPSRHDYISRFLTKRKSSVFLLSGRHFVDDFVLARVRRNPSVTGA